MFIERSHSEWGLVKLEAKKNSPFEWCFYYSDGTFMGGLSSERGGMLSHPNADINKFLKSYFPSIYLHELDETAYRELEMILVEEVSKVEPDFFEPIVEAIGPKRSCGCL